MKKFSRIVLLVALVVVIYFATMGSEQFHSLLDFFSDLIQMIADNYLKK